MNATTVRDGARANCRFCSLVGGAGDVFDSTWLAEGRYRAMVSVGALTPGWSLVTPQEHVVNLREMYRTGDFWDFASNAADILEKRYGKCAYFEHGAAGEGSLTGCGVDHAHGHLVPLSFSLELAARKTAPELDWRECLATEVAAVTQDKEYLFVASEFCGKETKGSLAILGTPLSQFFRRVIAHHLGVSEMYDYKKYPMLDTASKTAHELREEVSALVGV